MDLTNTLKLLIEKGPREGETLKLNSKPGFTVRIGRIVRGNTFAIKDNGISTKHLAIEWCSQGKWVVKDLDSSNGTFLNSIALPPLTAHDLRDGDVLEVGEVTSIRVQISHVSDSQPLGRNLRSKARVLGTGNRVGFQNIAEKGNRRGRGRGRGNGDGGLGIEIPDSVDLDASKEGNVPEEENEKGRRRDRGRERCRSKVDAKSGGESLGSEVPASISSVNSDVNTEAVVRRGRSQAKGKIVLQKPEVNSKSCENAEGGPMSKKRTKSSKNEEDQIDTMGESSLKTGISLGRMTRSRAMKNIDNSALERIPEASLLEGSMNCGGLENAAPAEKPTRRGRKKKQLEVISELLMKNIVEEDERGANELISEQETCQEMEIAVNKPELQSNIEGIVSNGGVDIQESTGGAASDKDRGAEFFPDLSKMTVGKWLDYLEWFLPKQIRAETEQVVQDIKKRSQQFHDFLLQQQKDKMSTAP